jgi:hypothetical protein
MDKLCTTTLIRGAYDPEEEEESDWLLEELDDEDDLAIYLIIDNWGLLG